MHLEVQQPAEEIQAGYLHLQVAFFDGMIHKRFGFAYLLDLRLLINGLPLVRICVRSHNRYNIQTVGILIRLKLGGSPLEILRCHQVILVVHPQDTLPQ